MSEQLVSLDDGRRVIRPRGTSGRNRRGKPQDGGRHAYRGPDAARAPLGERLSSLASVVLLGGLFVGSLVTAFLPSEFADEAPIRLAADLAPPAGDPTLTVAEVAPAEPATDPRPVGTLGPVRGAVEDTPPPTPGGPKVIEIPKDGPVRDPGPIIIRDPSDMRQPPRIAHLPDRDLIDDGPSGLLPVRANGRRPLDVYAGRWSGRRGNRIAIVVGGIGISQSGSKEAIEKLPGSVTLGFSPAGNSLKRWMEAARRDGHELLVQVPMQAFGGGGPDPRRQRLTLDATASENGERLRRSLGRLTNYVGAMNYTGGAFQADANALSPVIRELRDRGLMYLDDGSSGQSQAVRVASGLGAPFAGADIVIDAERRPGAIMKQLDRLEELARGTGRAIGVASAFPDSVDAIARWVEGVESRGFEVVPVSALASDPGGGR